MSDEFPSNSRHGGPPGDQPPAEEKKNTEPVITGKVIRRKKPLGRRIKETLFSGDTNSVGGYLIRDVLIPALQNLVTDFVQQGIERAVFGENRTPNRTTRRFGSDQGRTVVSYNEQYRNRPTSATGSGYTPAARRNAAPRQVSLNVDDIILDTRFDAENVLDRMFETIEKYKTVTLADLNSFLGQSSMYTDNAWGWTELHGADIKRERDGYRLILPQPEDLRH